MFSEQIDFHNQKDFLNYFLPWNNDLNGFVFRGQADHTWKLIPNALRDLKPSKVYISVGSDDFFLAGPNERIEIGREFLYLREFYRMADRQGLRVPHSESLRKNLSLEYDPFLLLTIRGLIEWIPTELHEIAGLAQHYGIPTRLLDWTYDPFVAIYFALKEAISRDGKLCVWCLNKKLLTSQVIIGKNEFIKFVTPPYFDNPNLNAQKGLFTHIPCIVTGQEVDPAVYDVDTRSLDERIKEHLREMEGFSSMQVFKKITLPCNVAIQAFRSLHEHGYGEARIYPGYKGIVEELLNTPH